MLKPNAQGDGIRRRGLWGSLDHEGGALRSGARAPMKDARHHGEKTLCGNREADPHHAPVLLVP